jgi:hypothetical protein
LGAVCALYLICAGIQLGLPGLHYDEAREAGVNAMELVAGQSVTAFRDAAIYVAGVRLPLMVQDYIGALNVYLATPFLAVSGIGVPNLRLLPLLTGLLTLLALERAVSEWWALWADGEKPDVNASRSAPISIAGLAAVTLLALSPSFVFWSRQGIFVTNLTQPLCLVCLWQGVRWWRSGRARALIACCLAAGLALYAKLLAIWIVGPLALLGAGWWLWRRRAGQDAPAIGWRTGIAAAIAGLLPLLPVIVFNVQTQGTWAALGGNLARSYYGVDNTALAHNLAVRLGQIAQTLRGDHFWYLGGLYANRLAPWLAAIAVGIGLWRHWRMVAPPLLLLACAVAASVVTLSDLFITHYALLQPIVVGVVAVGLGAAVDGIRLRRRQWLAAALFLAVWVAGDAAATVRYHLALAQSGGLAGHSDASYHLAYYLRHHGLGAPVALDWGMDATVRFLSQGTVRPIEIFGYETVVEPDAGFAGRLTPFLDNPDNVYLLHAPEQTVFGGRRELFLAEASARGLEAVLEQKFAQRDGTPLFEVWRVR